jgi:hypothetical protein
MQIHPLIKKACAQIDYDCQKALNAINIPDEVQDLKMFIHSIAEGKTCEVTAEEAIRYMRLIEEAFEGVEFDLRSAKDWLKAMSNPT